MAGFVGICAEKLTDSKETVKAAAKETVYSGITAVKEIHSDHSLILAKSLVSFIELPRMEAEQNDVRVWIDGEIYNQNELAKKAGEVFAETLLNSYLQNNLDELLRRVDGIFIALIYDQRQQQLNVVTDRYGLKTFYLYARNNCLILAPELKCFPHFSVFRQQIRTDVVDSFIQLEHLMGTATWFEGVEVTVPSTVYTYSWKNSSLTKKRYWSWSMIKRSSISLEAAAEEMGSLLDAAVKSRNFGNYRVGLGLSGGFDSRAMLAAIRKDKPVTYTFGIENSPDVEIAKQVAAVAGVKNIHFDMHVDQWIEKRFSGIWKTDGMLNMYHMHYSHLMNEIPKIMDVNLSGFLGDGVLGSTYLSKKGKTFLNKRIDEQIARHYYGEHYVFSDPADSFFDLNKIDIYLFYNRGRRLTGLGMEEANKTIHQRPPFMDIRLMDFSYSLPDEYRENSRAYHRALILKYPEFYRNIPHATSGVPINLDPTIFYKMRKSYHRWKWVAKFKLGIPVSFTDVYNWVKEPQTADFIHRLLNPKTALYPNYTKINFPEAFLEPHLRGKGNFAKKIMGAVTMEIWLQQIINKKYR